MLDRLCERPIAARLDDERCILFRDDFGDVPHRRRYDRQPCSHRFDHRERKLLAVAGQRENVEQADHFRRPRDEAGQVNAVLDSRRLRGALDLRTLGSFAENHQLPILGQTGESAHQPRQVLDRAQPGERAEPELALVLDQVGQYIGPGPGRIGSNVDAVSDPVDPAARLMPDFARDAFEPARGHHQRLRPVECDPAIKVAPPLEAPRFILVEPVFVMDERRQAHRLGIERMRQNRVHRAPIISQHEVELLHPLGN